MVIRPVVIAVLCVGLFLILESLMLPIATALKTNGYRMEDQRTRKTRNYMMQRPRDKEILSSLQDRGGSYDAEAEPMDAVDTIPEQLAYILDYANTIDDEYFLDKSVETRTRKRGNIKLEKHSNQALSDPPCSCHYVNTWDYLDDDVFPRKLPKRVCNKTLPSGCPLPYKCQEIYHNVPILKKKSNRHDRSLKNPDDTFALVPNHLNISWYAELKEVAVGCQCVKEYKDTIPTK